MSPVIRPNTPNAVNTPGPLGAHPSLPSATSARADTTKSSAKHPGPLEAPPTLSGTQKENPKAQAKAPDSLKQPPRQSSKRPRAFDQMPTQAGPGSVAATSHIPAPVQSATQAVMDPFPMDEGWESLELFDVEVNTLSEASWAHEAELSQAIASNGVATLGPLEPQAALPSAAFTQVNDSKRSAKKHGPLEQPPPLSSKRPRDFSQRSSQGISGPVAERAHSTVSGRVTARAKETPLHLDQDRGVQESLAPHAKRLSGAAGRTSAKGVGLSREVQKAQFIQAMSVCASEVSGLASNIDAVLVARAKPSDMSVTMKYVRSSIKRVAALVEKQALIAPHNQASLEDLQATFAKSTEVKNALQMAVANAFSDESVIQIKREMARAFSQGEQFLAQAAASITANAARPVLSYPDNGKAVLVSAAAAASVFRTAYHEAMHLSPSSEGRVKRSMRSLLKETEEGRVVLRFVTKAMHANSLAESIAAQKLQIVQKISEYVSEVSRCASVVQTADRLGDEQAFSVAVSQSVIRASGVLTQFVKTQARITENNQVTLGELEDARRKCRAGEEAMQMLEYCAFREESMLQIRSEISESVRAGHQSHAQAAAAIAVRAAGPVLTYPDIEDVVQATTAAAAAAVVTARQQANHLSPFTKAENERAIEQALKETEAGRAVFSFIAALRPPHLPTWPA